VDVLNTLLVNGQRLKARKLFTRYIYSAIGPWISCLAGWLPKNPLNHWPQVTGYTLDQLPEGIAITRATDCFTIEMLQILIENSRVNINF
jgi:hypothetical protein